MINIIATFDYISTTLIPLWLQVVCYLIRQLVINPSEIWYVLYHLAPETEVKVLVAPDPGVKGLVDMRVVVLARHKVSLRDKGQSAEIGGFACGCPLQVSHDSNFPEVIANSQGFELECLFIFDRRCFSYSALLLKPSFGLLASCAFTTSFALLTLSVVEAPC